MNRLHRTLTRMTALLLSVLLFACAPLAYATDLDTMRRQQQALAQQKSALEDEIAILAAQESEKVEYQAVLSEKIATVEAQIDAAIDHIEILNTNIEALELSLEQSAKEIEETMELLKKRLATLYAAGKVSTLEILFNAQSLHDFSVRSELVTRITHHDKQLIDQVSDYMEKTAAERTELEAQKETLAEEKKLLEASQIELDQLIAENNVLLEQIRDQKGAAQANLQRTRDEANYISNAIADFLEQKRREEEAAKATPTPAPTAEPSPTPTAEPTLEPGATATPTPTPTPTPDPFASAEPTPTPEPSAEPTPTPEPEAPTESFSWPLPGYSYITDSFGNGHYGLDVGAPRGTPIVASRSGTVMIANSTDEWGQSWGYHVSIYHDDNYSTLYAHMSEVAVSSGQWVEKGQVIGYVGNTGYSFGNHLHFEVYQDGTRVDPGQFV